jgi:hypothetical protein
MKYFLSTVGSVCRVKTFTTGSKNVAKVSLMKKRLKWRLLCCGFRSIGKSMGQAYQCWWRICREINAFSRFECHMFYILYPIVTYLLTICNSAAYSSWECMLYWNTDWGGGGIITVLARIHLTGHCLVIREASCSTFRSETLHSFCTLFSYVADTAE